MYLSNPNPNPFSDTDTPPTPPMAQRTTRPLSRPTRHTSWKPWRGWSWITSGPWCVTAWTHSSLRTRLTSAWRMPSSACFPELTRTWSGRKAWWGSWFLLFLQCFPTSNFKRKYWVGAYIFLFTDESNVTLLSFSTYCSEQRWRTRQEPGFSYPQFSCPIHRSTRELPLFQHTIYMEHSATKTHAWHSE